MVPNMTKMMYVLRFKVCGAGLIGCCLFRFELFSILRGIFVQRPLCR